MQINEDLLARYLLRDTDEAENRAIAQWRQDLPTNEQTIQDFEKLWTKTEAIKPDFPAFDADKAWAKMATFMEKSSAQEAKVVALPTSETERGEAKVRKITFGTGMRIAASVLLLGVVGWFFMQNFFSNNPEKETLAYITREQARQITLDDKSSIQLGHQAKLAYPEKFGKKNRTVKFEGQAHFDIAPDASRPFIIETSEQATVKVLGTSFDIMSYIQTDRVEVSVSTGKVEVSAGKQKIVLQAGETGVWAGKEGKLSKYTNAQFVQQQKTALHSLDFQNVALSDIIDRLNVQCGTKLEVAPHLQKCPLTVKFEKQNLETMLQIISETLELSQENGENGYTLLTGKGCL